MNVKRIFLLLVISLICVDQSLQAKGVDISMFWQVAPNADSSHYMFSNNDPSAMGKTYGVVTDATMRKVFGEKNFNQYIAGPYFTLNNTTNFYITGPTNPPKTKPVGAKKKTLATIKGNINIQKIRLASLGLIDGKVTSINKAMNSSFKNLAILGNMLLDMSFPNNMDIWNIYGPGMEWQVIPVEMYKVLSTTFQKKLITNNTLINLNVFQPVAGLKAMEATTYFGGNIVFKLHLITPGRQKTITSTTTLADVVNRQNTYTDLYPLEGESKCGDNFGF
jgi:hypothetical protein